jgi:hypothetical protein
MCCLCLITFISTVSLGQEPVVSHGILSQSNQWKYDETDSYVYLGIERTRLLSGNWNIGHFTVSSKSGGDSQSVFMLSSQARIYGGENISFWGDYALGIHYQDASLYDRNHGTYLVAENSQVMLLPLRLGFNFSWDRWHFVVPFLGLQATENIYRISSSLSSAERQGDFLTFGPSVGVHVNMTALAKVSLILEVEQQQMLQTAEGMQSSADYMAGLGWYF